MVHTRRLDTDIRVSLQTILLLLALQHLLTSDAFTSRHSFPPSCLPPDHPEYGQPIENLPKRKPRRSRVVGHPSLPTDVSPPLLAGPQRLYKPYAPKAGPGADSPERRSIHSEDVRLITPSWTHGSSHPTPLDLHERLAQGPSRTTADGERLRSAPYPATSPEKELGSRYDHRHYHNRNASSAFTAENVHASQRSADSQRVGLPSIASFDVGSPSSGRPSSVGLPHSRIGSIREMISTAELDVSAVLRRMRMEEGQDLLASSSGRSAGSDYPSHSVDTPAPLETIDNQPRHQMPGSVPCLAFGSPNLGDQGFMRRSNGTKKYVDPISSLTSSHAWPGTYLCITPAALADLASMGVSRTLQGIGKGRI